MNVIINHDRQNEEGIADVVAVTVGWGSIIVTLEEGGMPRFFNSKTTHSVIVYPNGDDGEW